MKISRSLLLSALFLYFSIFGSEVPAQTLLDPSRNLEKHILKNGTKVYLAPSSGAKTTQIQIFVEAGQYNDKPGKRGTAHLLEHLLFTDAKFSPEMSYLEKIKEMGGSANAYTMSKQTSYFATVTPANSDWIIDTMGDILAKKEFTAEQVRFAKGPVVLEIGRPDVFDYYAQYQHALLGRFNVDSSFGYTEFGKKYPDYPGRQDRLDTNAISEQDINDFYQTYYHPENMTILFAGKFSSNHVLQKIKNKFEKNPAREGKAWVEPEAKPRIAPYKRSTISNTSPYIQLGTKVYNISLQDEVALRIYMRHLAFRMQKEFRNKNGQTYTAMESINIEGAHGFAALGFESPADVYRKNYNFVKSLMQKEATEGNISPELFQEAKKIYESQYALTDADSDSMLMLAKKAYYLDIDYPQRSQGLSDFSVFQTLSLDSYKNSLQKLFSPKMSFEKLQEPPLFFVFENYIAFALSFTFWLLLLKPIFMKKFTHNKIRWVRNIAHPPVFLLQVAIFCLTIVLGSVLTSQLFLIWYAIGLGSQAFYIAEYAKSFFDAGVYLLLAQFLLGRFAGKAMVVENQLWIKSVGLSSKIIDLNFVESIEIKNIFQLLLSPRLLWKAKHRIYFYNPCFWRNGLCLTLRDNRVYFLGLTQAEFAAKELMEFIHQSDASFAKVLSLAETQSEDAQKKSA